MRAYPSGHLYFALKDENSQIAGVCFRSAAVRLKFELQDGMAVLAHGSVEIYQPRGSYQFVVDSMEPRGAGALQLAFEKLKKELEAEGLFDPARKRRLPARAGTVGIVTSPAGAAIHDMLQTMRLHRVGVRVLFFPSLVQGDGAAEQVADGIRALNEDGRSDVLIVGRGGGSLEDLWCFNEEPVARAIAASRIPVISAVGHEVDYTIADFVADVRAATPTGAAQLIVAGWEESRARVGEAGVAVVRGLERMLADRELRLGELVRHRAFEVVRARFAEAGYRIERLSSAAVRATTRLMQEVAGDLNRLRQELARLHPIERVLKRQTAVRLLAFRMEGVLRRLLERRGVRLRGSAGRLAIPVQARLALVRTRMEAGCGRLNALSPLGSLGRGYAICRKPDGTVVSRVAQVEVQDPVMVQVADGTLDCRVTAARADRDVRRRWNP